MFYLPILDRDYQHYLLQVELLTLSATVSAFSAQKQQQIAVLDRDEVVFQSDKLSVKAIQAVGCYFCFKNSAYALISMHIVNNIKQFTLHLFIYSYF